MNLNDLGKEIGCILKRRTPEILIGCGITGFISSTILAAKAKPNADKHIAEKKEKTNKKTLSVLDKASAVWKDYAPSAALIVVSSACIIGASSIHTKRNAALATVYNLTETAFVKYQNKVAEVLGDKKEKEIRDRIHTDELSENKYSEQKLIVTNRGDCVIYDRYSGRYFTSTIQNIRKAENKINKQLLTDGYASLNDLYFELGLEPIKAGDDIGWNINKYDLDIYFGSQLMDNDEPCVVMDFVSGPVLDFDKFY